MNLVLNVTALENNNASNMFLMNNTTNLVQMTMKGLTGTPGAGGTSKAVTSLDPTGSITTASPYVQNCSSVNANATGIQIDGLYIVQVINQFLQMTLHKLTLMVWCSCIRRWSW